MHTISICILAFSMQGDYAVLLTDVYLYAAEGSETPGVSVSEVVGGKMGGTEANKKQVALSLSQPKPNMNEQTNTQSTKPKRGSCQLLMLSSEAILNSCVKQVGKLGPEACQRSLLWRSYHGPVHHGWPP